MKSGTKADLRPPHVTPPPTVEVAAGLIVRHGRLLIARRYPGSHLGGLWEFPGGKREKGETFEEALVRELQEELDVTVSVGEMIEAVEHTYPDKTVRIRFFRCRIRSGEPRPVGCHGLKWIPRSALGEQRFPEADEHLLERLAREAEFWSDATGD